MLLSQAEEHVGQKLGVSDWVFIDQTQVNVFGEVTRWRTPGHCDPEYGKTTPLKETVGNYAWHGKHHLAHIKLALEAT